MAGLPDVAAHVQYLLLFGTVFLAQLMMIFPIVPLLVSAGALAAHGTMSAGGAIVAAAAGLVLADLAWYQVGRWRGARVLSLACRAALEPDECVRRAENLFARHGARLLLGARFVPGLITAALPLAGMFRMHRRRFVLYGGAGALLWAGVYVAIGLLFADQLATVGQAGAGLGPVVIPVVAGALAVYIAVRYIRRQRFLRGLRVARIDPEELQARLAAGEQVTVVDLRHPLDFESDPHTIPGALYIPAEELGRRHREIPRRREIVLYCT